MSPIDSSLGGTHIAVDASNNFGSRWAFDLQIGAGGALADLEPYNVELDLSGAASSEVAVILVRNATGLGNDPSTFAAILIVIASASSATSPTTK